MEKTFIINRDELLHFARRNRLAGIAGVLQSLHARQGMRRFLDYLAHCGYEIPDNPCRKALFHGSSRPLRRLLPRGGAKRGKNDNGYVYATRLPDYAIFLALLRLRGGGASVAQRRGRLELWVDLDFINGPSRLAEGYVHILPAEGFAEKDDLEFRARDPVSCLFALRVTPADLSLPVQVKVTQ